MSLESSSRACKELFAGGKYIGPVIVIAGPTGSGKTGVSIEIALALGNILGLPEGEIGAEIISADSRAIYKYMDIGTAKPDLEERAGVTHYGFDLVEPGERFTVADWKEYAEQKICSIRERGHVPIVCGGTGLYIDALVFNYQFNNSGSEQNICSESGKNEPDRQEMSSEYLVFAISWPSEDLRNRLRERMNKLFVQDLYDETRYLVENYGWDSQAMKSNIYQFAWGYLQGKYTLEEAKDLFFYDDWHLAKRQMTWFRRNPNIKWLPLSKMKDEILSFFK